MALHGLTFCITGAMMSGERAQVQLPARGASWSSSLACSPQVQRLIRRHGGQVTTSVTGVTSHLLAHPNELAPPTTKVVAARRLGVPIVREQFLVDAIARGAAPPEAPYAFPASAFDAAARRVRGPRPPAACVRARMRMCAGPPCVGAGRAALGARSRNAVRRRLRGGPAGHPVRRRALHHLVWLSRRRCVGKLDAVRAGACSGWRPAWRPRSARPKPRAIERTRVATRASAPSCGYVRRARCARSAMHSTLLVQEELVSFAADVGSLPAAALALLSPFRPLCTLRAFVQLARGACVACGCHACSVLRLQGKLSIWPVPTLAVDTTRSAGMK